MQTINLETAFRATRGKVFSNPYISDGVALRRIEMARANLEKYHARNSEYETARDHLKQVWESGGMKESAPGLAFARQAERDRMKALSSARALVAWYGDSGSYVGTWQPNKPGMFYVEKPESLFRSTWKADETGAVKHGGWFDNEHGESARDGSGLIWGVVAQLAGKDGRARFVAGWKQGDSCGACFDLSTIYCAPGDDEQDARREAGRAGDSMAERVADDEREFKRAWEAGQEWRDLLNTEQGTRRELLDLMAERRAARDLATGGQFSTICARLHGMIETGLESIKESREKRRDLWNDTPRALEPAFMEGADLDRKPA